MFGMEKSDTKEIEKDKAINKEVENFANNLKSELGKNEIKDEKSSSFSTDNEESADFDLSVSDILDILGDDSVKSFLAMPEKMAVKFALKDIPETDRSRFQINPEGDKRFTELKLRLTKKIIQKYGGNLNAKVSPEIALAAITAVSCSFVYVQLKAEVNRYLIEQEMLKKSA